uniref:Nuclear speckle splicing regulatory protein 1 N-terminal domain-containing protein n=1 Tax=Plectus sambesii TaxID=2011161 RepID=A0A914UVM6_9BILA
MANEGKKSFGLILKKGGKATLDSMAKANRPSVFGDDEDDEKVDTNMMARVKLSASEVRVKKQAEREQDRALAEDPMIFDYDAKYEEDQAKKNEKLPKYVPALLKAHKRRELEMQSREERKQQKERIAEGEQFADKETFVTGAYRSQMEDMEKYREEEARESRLEALMDVTKQKDYQAGFYRHLLNDLTRDGTTPSTATVKKEPTDDAKDDEKTRERAKERATTSEQQSNAAKGKSYRRRRHSSSSSDEGAPKQRKSKRDSKPDKSIYSDDSDAEPVASRSAEEPPRKGGLQVRSSVTAAPSKGRSGVTRVEQQRRFFTPTPPSSPEPNRRDDKVGRSKESKRARSPRTRSKSPRRRTERKSPVPRADSKDQKEKEKENEEEIDKKPVVKAEPVRSRLERLKDLFQRKNGQESIDDYRQRYFERKANGLIVVPM